MERNMLFHSRLIFFFVLVIISIIALLACNGSEDSDNVDGDSDSSEKSDEDFSESDDAGESDEDNDLIQEIDGDTDAEKSGEGINETDMDSENAFNPDAMYAALSPSDGPDLQHRLGVASQMSQSVGDNLDRNFEYSVYKDLNESGGSVGMRNGMDWNSIESVEGQWQPEGLDIYVNMAAENGVTLVGPLDYAANWAITDDDLGTLDPQDFANYAAYVSGRYCDTVKMYEIWNEENIYPFWRPEPDAEHYGEILKAAYTAIKDACPDAVVSIGGLCSMTVGNFTHPRWEFLDKLYAAHPDICEYFDTLALHPYTFAQAYSPERDYAMGDLTFQSQTLDTALAREKLANMGCPGRDLWFTEFGWPSYNISQDAQARFLARSVLIAMKDDVRGMYWYTFYDFEPDPEAALPQEKHFGLYEWPGKDGTNRTPKPSFKAFKGLWTVLGKTRFAGDLSSTLELPNDVYVYAFMDEENNLTLALWDGREDPDGVFGDGQESNPETTYELNLPLPSWFSTVRRFDQEGNEIEQAVPQDGIAVLTLTVEVQYLKINR